MYYYIIISSIIGLGLYYNFTNIKHKYNKFKSLKKLVKTKHNNQAVVLLVSLSLLFKLYYIKLIQYLNSSIEKINNNTYEITYTINDVIYKSVIKVKKGPNNISNIYNENDEDITDIISPYVGANRDFGNISLTPEYFNMKEIKINLNTGHTLKFTQNDILNIDL